MSDLKQTIDNVIDCAFESITNLFKSEDGIIQGTRLCFPSYQHGGNKGKKRLSEQEFKQLFIEEFNKYCDENELDNLRYSVETPTKAGENAAGQSGNFDLTISEGDNIKAIIEFKARNTKYDRDIRKMCNPEEKDALCFLVNILEASYRSTFDSIKQKVNDLYKANKGEKTIYLRIYSMKHHATAEPMKCKDEIKA